MFLLFIYIYNKTTFYLMDSSSKDKNDLAVGIDFGNTKVCVAIWNQKRQVPEIIENEDNPINKRYFPSNVIVEITENKNDETKNNIPNKNVENDEYNQEDEFQEKEMKMENEHKDIDNNNHNKNISRDFSVSDLKTKFGFTGTSRINIKGNEFANEDLIKKLFSQILEKVEKQKEQHIGNVVISVPQDFTSSQRIAMKNIAKESGINNINIINESIAAALSYSRRSKRPGTENLLIIDMGSSKTEVNVITVGSSKTYKSLSSIVDRDLNGNTFTNELYSYVTKEYIEPEYGKKFQQNEELVNKIRETCEKAKMDLYSNEEAEIIIEKIDEDNDLNCTITREKYNELNKDNNAKVHKLVRNALEQAGIPKDKITHVFLLGDALLKNLKLSDELRQEYDDNGVMDDTEISIVCGNAVYAAILAEQMNKDYLKSITIYNLTSLSLGLKTEGDLMCVIIPRNSRYPIQKKRSFLTTEDFQTTMNFEIYEGERKLAKYNKRLYRMKLKQLPKRYKGEVKVDVTFTVDNDGILKVSAHESEGNIIKQSKILYLGNYEKNVINDKIKEGYEKKEQDNKEQERIKAMINLNNTIMNFSHQFQGCEFEQRQILDYKKWMQHAIKAKKEDFENKEKELKARLEPKDQTVVKGDNNTGNVEKTKENEEGKDNKDEKEQIAEEEQKEGEKEKQEEVEEVLQEER